MREARLRWMGNVSRSAEVDSVKFAFIVPVTEKKMPMIRWRGVKVIKYKGNRHDK